ncbi:protein MIZU-KUSSEI 1-like [Phoenix dactylifera]|uniref:Protein MIZU-KUSSEI 1-like n=1 Tax=Phoenix dactylifera TaxID=42345 RepID=A0A8B8J4P1_PHODC|nr:protein MIZU-KUSSEI 1-like [Phoenix dactylifera]
MSLLLPHLRDHHHLQSLLLSPPNEWKPMTTGSADVARPMDLSFSSSSGEHDEALSPLHLPLLRRRPGKTFSVTMFASSIFRSLFPTLRSFLTPACHWPVVPAIAPFKSIPSARRKVIGTFFGRRRGRVSLAMQMDPRSEPVLLLELATPMHQLVKEMASGMVRILLECDRIANTSTPAMATASKKKGKNNSPRRSLWEEPAWSLYCNGHQRGYAVSRRCNGADLHVLKALQAVSVGAGVLPPPPIAPPLPPPHSLETENIGRSRNDGGGGGGGGGGGADCEVMYLRAKFDRVVGNVDSEAFYMISPDGGGRGGSDFNDGGPELSIFLLRI